MSVTMKQIAEHMGVSRQLVSYALNDNGTISPSRKREILQIAAELGYQPNSLARAVATGRNRVLGFIGHDEANAAEFQWRLLRGASEEAKLHGYLIKILLTTDPDMAAQYCIESRLAGLLTVTVEEAGFLRLHQILKAQKNRPVMPMATMENEGPLLNGICVYSDYKAGLQMLLKHLLQLGHQKIAYIAGSSTEANGIARTQMFREAAAECNARIPKKWIVAGQWWNQEANRTATHQLLRAADRPTAIICAGDPIALSAVDAARSLNLNVPRDVSITGFADFQMAQYSSPPLTTVAQPFEQVGAAATRRLLERIERPAEEQPRSWPQEQELLEPSLIIRHSTAPPLH